STYVEKIIIRSKGLDLEYVRSLSLVKCLDLSSNNIAGPIPQGIGSLMGLIILNISRNHISGVIPESMGKMVVLESLDISRNQISGKIPVELLNLTFLSFLDLSSNHLSGMIPQGMQFSTFEVSSFSNNSGLCGYPLNVTCWPSSPTHEREPKQNERAPRQGEVGRDKEQGREGIDYFIVLVGTSFGMGVSVIIAPLLVLKKRRRSFFESLDRILVWVVDFVTCCDKLQITAMLREEEDTLPSEESRKSKRFCVHCTQIDK
ncbi:hypothetical protein KI387_037387, partial [Taxus chinensis]